MVKKKEGAMLGNRQGSSKMEKKKRGKKKQGSGEFK